MARTRAQPFAGSPPLLMSAFRFASCRAMLSRVSFTQIERFLLTMTINEPQMNTKNTNDDGGKDLYSLVFIGGHFTSVIGRFRSV
jgi:hypothetical protein